MVYSKPTDKYLKLPKYSFPKNKRFIDKNQM
jgi:hypothetical protein